MRTLPIRSALIAGLIALVIYTIIDSLSAPGLTGGTVVRGLGIALVTAIITGVISFVVSNLNKRR